MSGIVTFGADGVPEMNVEELFMALGRKQMADAIARIANVGSLEQLRNIKDSKAYRQLKGKNFPNVGTLTGTWADVATLLGVSVSKLDEDLGMAETFGEEAFRSMQSIGIGYRDLRQLRKLPDDSQKAVIEAAENGEKDKVLELVEDLVSRQQREKARIEAEKETAERRCFNLEKQLEGAEAELETARQKNKRVFERNSVVPLEVEELQDECMAAVKRTQLFFGSLAQQARAAEAMSGDWGTGCRRHVFASMQAIAVGASMLLKEWSETFGIAIDDADIEPVARVEPGRAQDIQEMYDALTISHDNQAHNRKAQRMAVREKATGKKNRGAPLKERDLLPTDY